MPQQVAVSVENNLAKGLITVANALNFPENACTDVDNCDFPLVGDVIRRLGIDFEDNYETIPINRTNVAISYYRWLNAGGDGESKILVLQTGSTLRFFKYSDATASSPMSTTLMPDTIDILTFRPPGSARPAFEHACEFTEGNGYLFVTNPATDPFYITYIPDLVPSISASQINVQIRDFTGIVEANVGDSQRLSVNTSFHLYNLQNQGWLNTSAWTAASASQVVITTGPMVFEVPAGLPIVVSNRAIAYGNVYYSLSGVIKYQTYVAGIVTSYVGTTLTINVTSFLTGGGDVGTDWIISPDNVSGQISTFQAAVGLYPSNSDVWWYFKDNTGVFSPATTLNNTSLGSGPAPKGFYILNAFNQRRDQLTGLTVPIYATAARPRTNAWFAGRVWYAGVDDTKLAPGYYYPYTWTENIYFSQIITSTSQFGKCYQTNDPTSETLFDLLPTDGGVITIQGCGPIYKLHPIQNGMLVFTGNGIWFITGSQGIGFTANDYTITQISSIKSISSSSFVDVNGIPYFWNEEGIYAVQPQQGGSLSADNLVVSTIQNFYDDIPLSSKMHAKGFYNPVEYAIQWVYRSTEAADITERYTYDRILNYNTFSKAFFPYTIATSPASVQGVVYITNVGGDDAPDTGFKYIVSQPVMGTYNFTFAEAKNTDYEDWGAIGGVPFDSFFISGYRLRGKGIQKFQHQYIQVYNRQSGLPSAYKIQGLWNYSNSGNSGRWTTEQVITNGLSRFDTAIRRHKIRGNGYALQFKISSVTGMPFDIQGWASVDTVNAGT